MFRKSGAPSAFLTHAVHQVRDWHMWIHDNLAYARRLLPHVDYPLGRVFIGRRSELSADNRRRLKRLLFENRMFMEIRTLDFFVDGAESVRHLVSAGGARWTAPPCSFTHRDLAARRPNGLFSWLESPEVGRRRSRYAKERQEGRACRFDIELLRVSRGERGAG
jgi:hypothetical protein